MLRRSAISTAALVSLLAAAPAMAESKSFVVTWFGQAMDSKDGDCPDGVNPRWAEQRLRNLRDLGLNEKQIADLVAEELLGEEGMEASKIADMNVNRGRINGKPVNAYTYPSTVVDPKLHAIRDWKWAFGFNLDGKIGASDFEDPETHEKGVDNEFGRAMGCMPNFRGSLKEPPLEYAWVWAWKREGRSAWVITITANDITKDGDARVTFDRAIERLRFNADSTPRRDMPYRVDPSPRSHFEYAAKIKDGMLTLANAGTQDFNMIYNPEFIPVIRMTKVHMRMKITPDGGIEGMIGGYQRWDDLYISYASGGKANEDGNAGDLPGIYYLLKKYADHDPSPANGQNMAISATWNFTGVPAFAVIEDPSGELSEHH